MSGARIELQSPSPFVGSMVMEAADRDQIVQIGGPVVLIPFEQVVDLAVVEPPIALADGAGAVHRPQRSPLSGCGVTSAASDVEGHAA